MEASLSEMPLITCNSKVTVLIESKLHGSLGVLLLHLDVEII